MVLKKFKANQKSTRGNKQAWKKGQSCSYNPQCKKFRDEVKLRSKFGFQGAESKLTEYALTQHNKQDGNYCSKTELDKEFDETTLGGLSFVSTFSNCTNPTFNHLLKRWQSNSFLHKEMLAVLAAVTEVIKAKGGKETETEYFAALMTTLEVVDTDEARTAVLSLLYMVVKRLPSSVLKLNFSKTCPLLKDILVKYKNSDFNALLRNLLGCLFYFLKVQEPCNWDNYVKDVYTIILEFTIHHKPKVRKCAQNAVSYLLNNAVLSSDVPVHSCAVITAQFCIKTLESNGGLEGSSIHHILNLLKDVMGCFPKATLKLCCETLLRVITLSKTIVTTSCLKALQGMFIHKPKPENLPDELNVRIIKALYDYQPNVNDCEILIDWLLVMECAFINLHRLNAVLCIDHLPSFFKTSVACYLSDKDEVHFAVSSTLTNVLYSCIIPSSPEFQQFIFDDPVDNPMCKVFRVIERALSYQYHKAWKQVLIVLSAFFDVMGKHLHPVMIKCLQSMADLRDSFKFPYTNELDKAFGVAIHRMGPEVVLKAVPLQISGENDKLDFPRSWLLPLLRENVKETELGFFIRYFLPLVSQLRKKVIEYQKDEKMIESKVYDVICSQIWSLLPGFCTLPTDLKQSFKAIARILGTTLNEQPALRTAILSCLRILISKNLENEENKEEISRFAKNYLPILFNLYSTESKDKTEEGVRLAVFDTIKVYLQITDRELCRSLFVKAMEKLKDPCLFTQHALLDLNKLLLPYVTEGDIKELYNYCKPLLQHSNHTVQRKSYGVMSELCSNSSESCLMFVQNNIDDLKSVLLTSLASSSPPSKALRLSCLKNIVHHLSVDNKDFVVAIVPEATLCTKATAVKARTAAYKLLEEIGHTLFKWNPDNKKSALQEYLQMLLAGFAGDPHVISATILSVGHIIYTFKDEVDTDLIHLFIENVCLLLTSRSREVVTSGLSFIKILFSTISTVDLAQHVDTLIKSIASISEDNQRAFRFKARELFTRLIRKFGYEMISKLAPQQFQKQLRNIHKVEQRKSKRKSSNSTYTEQSSAKTKSDLIDDVLDDTDEELEECINRNVPKKTEMTYIKECENDIVDFMDPSANQKILATKPAEHKVKSTGFEVAEDGRIIIPKENEETSKKRKRKSEEDSFELVEETATAKKKKVCDMSEEEDDIDTCKAVSKGIHRTLKPEIVSSKKAGGDSKKGNLDPYTYIPLNPQALNKRKQRKMQGQFRGIINAARRGSVKGSRQRNQKRKK